MTTKKTSAEVLLWGTTIGYVIWDTQLGCGIFEYDPHFRESGIDLSPLKMPLNVMTTWSFPQLRGPTFHGLPGMLADALPDKFGNAIIDEWLARQGRTSESFNPVERLCYTGTRGMGALEFKPSSRPLGKVKHIAVEEMVKLASQILSHQTKIHAAFKETDSKSLHDNINDLLLIGTSAGGARAKCVIAYNESTGEVCSGQIDAPQGFSHWLLKLDGVINNKDKEINDPQGYGAIEYAYYLMALDSKIHMSPCRLLSENGRQHFMSKRFDRTSAGQKLHMQSLCALGHFDFNLPRAYSYEQAMAVIREIVTESVNADLEQLFRRAVFNVIGRNQDDHTKNIAFLMNKEGKWRISPAYDVTYSYNPKGQWTSQHQMLLNGKADGFSKEDLIALAKHADIKKTKALQIVAEVIAIFLKWETYAKKAGVFEEHILEIKKHFRRSFD